jgi:hypothetical protein
MHCFFKQINGQMLHEKANNKKKLHMTELTKLVILT